jgi:cation diffusion facilitator CzcD-associated flavoprotein CzcO
MPSDRPEAFDVIVIGAGPGGICTTILLKQAGIEDVLVLERSCGVGGTWFNSDYPGLACDIASDLYSFSFFQDYEWLQAYAPRAEILKYLQDSVERFEVADKFLVDTGVASARWLDDEACWLVVDTYGKRRKARVLVGAVGMFNDFVLPDIPGVDRFEGDLMQTPVWPQDGLDRLAGRRVSVIGTAASGVQVIPTIAPIVDHLTVFQRMAAWIFPKDDEVYTDERLRERREDPSIAADNRARRADTLEVRADLNDEALMAELRAAGLANLESVEDAATREALTPRTPIGAQRLLLSSTYYPTYNRENVELVTSPIREVEHDAIVTSDGRRHPTDALVLATGYLAHQFLSIVEVSGRGGVSLRDHWKDGAYAYLGMTVDDFPNLFMLYGPNTNGGSIIDKLEIQAKYIVRKTRQILEHRVVLEVRPEVIRAYNERLQADLAAIEAWQVEGSRYYRSPSGRIVTQSPYTVLTYKAMTEADDAEAFDVTRAADARSTSGVR